MSVLRKTKGLGWKFRSGGREWYYQPVLCIYSNPDSEATVNSQQRFLAVIYKVRIQERHN